MRLLVGNILHLTRLSWLLTEPEEVVGDTLMQSGLRRTDVRGKQIAASIIGNTRGISHHLSLFATRLHLPNVRWCSIKTHIYSLDCNKIRKDQDGVDQLHNEILYKRLHFADIPQYYD